ncbi:MAG: LDCC motif putative metal-binding protein [Spirochaeta sp.]|jgi:hypothetical protein|nr:LDCC motif putative metal-binding protein [Spirochaeta sp.]
MAGTTITEMMAVELGSTDTPDQATIAKLRDGSGIEEMTVNDNRIDVEYQPYVVSREGVLNRMEHAGLVVRRNGDGEQKKRQGLFRRFIDRIAADNQRSLGSGPLDCCDLNRGNRPQ